MLCGDANCRSTKQVWTQPSWRLFQGRAGHRSSPRAGALSWVLLSSSPSVLGEEKSLYCSQEPQNSPVCVENFLSSCAAPGAADPGCSPPPHGRLSRGAWVSRGHFLFPLEAGAIAGSGTTITPFSSSFKSLFLL